MYLLLLLFFTKWALCVDSQVQTLYTNDENFQNDKKTHIFDASSDSVPHSEEIPRTKREAGISSSDVVIKANHINDTHRQLLVHWMRGKSKVIICLARDRTPIVSEKFATISPSTVFISYDDGDYYQNKTESFKLADGGYATLEMYHSHPNVYKNSLFTDIQHNVLFVTTDYGKTFERRDLNFTPSEIFFHEVNPSILAILDKNTTNHRLWVTEDFGKSFRMVHEFVMSFYWSRDTDDNYHMIVQKSEPSNLSTIFHSVNSFKNDEPEIYDTNVKDLLVKGDYLFSTKYNDEGNLNLYVSYKLGARQMCVFDSSEKFISYFIVDVTNFRALVAAAHSNTTSHLYLSKNLVGNDKEVKFTLSLKDVFVFIPSVTWQNTWLQKNEKNAFAEVYKVKSLTGIYIASRVNSKPVKTDIKPEHLGSVITFDHGVTWRLIQPPASDADGQSSGCLITNNCSLHLNLKFNELWFGIGSARILSSEHTPGIIMATGGLGKNFKDPLGVYITSDGGITWRQKFSELHYFNIGDHGGILTAVKHNKGRGGTNHIEYSVDEGRNWNQTVFHNEKIKLYGLMTEPGETTTVFTMFGFSLNLFHWIIFKVDFTKIFKRNCTNGDYEMWSPRKRKVSERKEYYIPCDLGKDVTYQKRMPSTTCLNGQDYMRNMSIEVCECDLQDFDCDFGFIKVGSPPRCVREKSTHTTDVDKIPVQCKPGDFYNRTKGYHKLAADSCVGGLESHYLPEVLPCPLHQGDDSIFFAQKTNIMRYNLVDNSLKQIPVPNLINVVAIELDMTNNCIFWADIDAHVIGRHCFLNGNTTEILVSNNISSVEGLAFDWISKTLYFVDGVRATIELIKTNVNQSDQMRRTILNSTVLRKPRGIALHPHLGYMFWTDWFAKNPSVNRANLDGSDNMTLFGSDTVTWPNGITIDYSDNRLYWVDARLDYIGRSDLQGEGFVKVVSNTDVVSHPFAIAVFKNNIYWDDWIRRSIFSANIDNFNDVQVVLKHMPVLMGLKAFTQGIQTGTNACSNTTCPYICVALPKNAEACLCPDGLIMQKGKCMCPGNIEPLVNFTCPSVTNSCSVEQFMCSNRKCIPKDWKCDGKNDCEDNSDELQCNKATCAPSFLACGDDGRCLPSDWRCDGDYDCIDRSDEANCTRYNCTQDQFKCGDETCISSRWLCDGELDCRDGSDEMNCADRSTTCKYGEFRCEDDVGNCIPNIWKCDGENDCRDGSDENSCENKTCNASQMSCGPPMNRCIFKQWMCDGDKDCDDGRDEANCTLDNTEPPNEFENRNVTCEVSWMFRCKNQRCIPYWWVCDSSDDCQDNSDEVNCSSAAHSSTNNSISPNTKNVTCEDVSMFKCKNGDCIPVSWICDGADDCKDNSDELNCSSKPRSSTNNSTSQNSKVVCGNDQFQCNGSQCIPFPWVCDGMIDCLGEEDEKNCNTSTSCSLSQFKCQIDGSCIEASAVCDGRLDCPDKTDELSCKNNLPEENRAHDCSIGLFACNKTCHPKSLLCDGTVDCEDGYDEKNCSTKNRVYQVTQMDIDQSFTNATALFIYWRIIGPVEFEFQPSIKKIDDENWKNESWTNQFYHQFTNLQPFTEYNITVYVRIKGTNEVFSPTIYKDCFTSESVPSEPWNVSAKQINGSRILVSWNKPLSPNGDIVSYELYWLIPDGIEIRIPLSGNKTSHLFSYSFKSGMKYTFQIVAHNRKYKSNKSVPFTLIFDGEVNKTPGAS